LSSFRLFTVSTSSTEMPTNTHTSPHTRTHKHTPSHTHTQFTNTHRQLTNTDITMQKAGLVATTRLSQRIISPNPNKIYTTTHTLPLPSAPCLSPLPPLPLSPPSLSLFLLSLSHTFSDCCVHHSPSLFFPSIS